jgi:hypothetical protein
MEGAAVGSPGGDRPGVRSGGRGAELVPEARDASGGEVWWVTAKRSRVVRRSCITAMPSRCRRRRLVAQHTHSSPSSSYNQVTTITRRSSHAMAYVGAAWVGGARSCCSACPVMAPGQALAVLWPPARLSARGCCSGRTSACSGSCTCICAPCKACPFYSYPILLCYI